MILSRRGTLTREKYQKYDDPSSVSLDVVIDQDEGIAAIAKIGAAGKAGREAEGQQECDGQADDAAREGADDEGRDDAIKAWGGPQTGRGMVPRADAKTSTSSTDFCAGD